MSSTPDGVRSCTLSSTFALSNACATGDSQLIFEVNGQTVADLNYDKVPSRGGVGIFAGGDLNEVVLERLRIDDSQ